MAIPDVSNILELHMAVMVLRLLDVSPMRVQLVSVLCAIELRVQVRYRLPVVIGYLRSETVGNYFLNGRHLW